MRLQRRFHLRRACPEDLKQIPVTTFEILEHLEPKNPVNDMIGPDFVRWIEVSGLSRRLERPDDDPGRIRAEK